MREKQLFKYIGLLGNVDDSILGVSLPNGYHFDVIPLVQMLEIGSTLTNESIKTLFDQWWNTKCIFDSQLVPDQDYALSDLKCYFLTKSFEVDVTNGVHTGPINETTFYSIELLRKINLFKKGNVCIPISFDYIINGDQLILRSSGQSLSNEAIELFSLEIGEEKKLQEFINKINLPDGDSYVGLALQNFELSYKNPHIGLSFITSVMALEVLFDAGAHKVARNVAVLLGRDLNESKKIFGDIKELHNKRSELVHSGKHNKVTKEDHSALKNYVRKSLVRLIELKMPKEQLIEQLNILGFGHGNALFNEPTK